MNRTGTSAAVTADMHRKGVDVELALSILTRLEQNDYSSTPTLVRELPGPNDPAVIDCTGSMRFTVARSAAVDAIGSLGIAVDPVQFATPSGADLSFDESGLRRLGTALSPFMSYGVLNGGSATSYADSTRNSSFDAALYEYYRGHFSKIIDPVLGRAKGLTPAFVQPDGSAGPSFLELKMRGLLVGTGPENAIGPLAPHLPMYQMTSSGNDLEISDAYETYRKSPLIKALTTPQTPDVTRVSTAVQPLIAAFSEYQGRWSIFSDAFGRNDCVLPLPGGHGQCFATLKPVFQSLRAAGKHWVLLGNVDNLGNLPKPEHLALLALTGAPAGFEFAYRTPVDIKGGILVRSEGNRLTCADIGPAISRADVLAAERDGAKILFNCATGLFSLDYLEVHIDRIIAELPLRVSKQEKDAGVYWQAEQITWEVISLMENPLVFGVDKYERFLAAKLFVECLLTSGIGLDDPRFPASDEIRATAVLLNAGLQRLLGSVYGMIKRGGVWAP